MKISESLALSGMVLLTFAMSTPKPGWVGWFGIVARGAIFVACLWNVGRKLRGIRDARGKQRYGRRER